MNIIVTHKINSYINQNDSILGANKANFKRGFTLLELFLVVALISTLAAASAPFYSRFILQNEVKNTADSLSSTLRKAEAYAMAGKDDSTWSVQIASNQIQLVRDSGVVIFDRYTLNSNIQISNFVTTSFAKTSGVPSQAFTTQISGAGSSRSVVLNSEGVVSN